MLSVGRPGAAADDLDLAALFAGLDLAPALLLAVSGGPDSVAMLHLAQRWRAAAGQAPRLHVATVDHGLRPEAAAEAATVAAVAAGYGLPHTTLAWAGPRPVGGIQAKAREARYRLLCDHARSIGAPCVLTAHHADDQAETVLMRLGRGSGVTGLAAMRRTSELADGVSLVRPLLGLTKRTLLAICTDQRLVFVTDRSNEDPTFHRVRLRRQSEAAAALGLDAATLVRLARRMARAEQALEAEVARKLDEIRPNVEPRSWRGDLGSTGSMAPEIVQRLLGRAARHVGGNGPVSLERLETLADALQVALESRRACRATLAGTLVCLDEAGMLTVTPEPPRRRGRPRPD